MGHPWVMPAISSSVRYDVDPRLVAEALVERLLAGRALLVGAAGREVVPA